MLGGGPWLLVKPMRERIGSHGAAAKPWPAGP
jgi:hypothetical protein